MKILVIGATGRLGSHLVTAALEKGHEVTAFARNMDDQDSGHPNLKLFKGDVMYQSLIEAALPGHDAVLSVIGIRKFSGPITLLSKGIGNITGAMKKTGVNRLLTVTGAGILQDSENRLIMETLSFPPNLQNISLDHRRVFRVLESSNLDWTIVCPAFMYRGEATKEFLIRSNYYPAESRNEVSLADVADFMTDEMRANQFVNQRVGIAGPFLDEEIYMDL